MSDCGCEKAKANLYELLRGELCAEESAPIREHIETCAGCQNEQSVCLRLTEVVRRACEEERENAAPVDLRNAILQGLRAE
ncbi:zf-HC2 domain-containing protein [Leucobacter chromiireducens]|uniref:Alpha-ketoglutarate decarboxylase n=1 Tax=Leucobacter chromiireducens subsp. chromiireducens TaxID=660067 RepID=A0ABS1SMN2_9MICO|nr:zf-HC2 domain-containing protein [Leucobacter chromiireducens]MBL3689348.1 alpha-ketoglutarate decarboxylase [Leucobacter chromiireducens subsp. chromiireducens]